MESHGTPILEERPLTPEERALTRSMLQRGGTQAAPYLAQLERARVVSRCPCGCASVDFTVDGEMQPSGGLQVLGDFAFGDGADVAGAFVFARGGVLAGVEVYALSGSEAPRALPRPEALRPLDTEGAPNAGPQGSDAGAG